MNKATRARWCNPLEGVGTEEGDNDSGYCNFWGEGGGLAPAKRAQGGTALLAFLYK